MNRHTQGVSVGRRGGDADPQSGERPRSASDNDRIDITQRQARIINDPGTFGVSNSACAWVSTATRCPTVSMAPSSRR